jgi:hypothetical protein
MSKWNAYGDVNPLIYGGTWVKKESDTNYRVVKFYPNEGEYNQEIFGEIQNLYVDISSNWIEKDEVMSYIDMSENNFNPELYAIACTDYYSVLNFGDEYDLKKLNEEEVLKTLNSLGIQL